MKTKTCWPFTLLRGRYIRTVWNYSPVVVPLCELDFFFLGVVSGSICIFSE